MRRFRTALVFVFALSMGVFTIPATAADVFPGCAAPPAASGPIDVVVGEVACQQLDATDTIGGVTAFSYYVPPNCDPAITPQRTCPVLTLLHGFGGTYQGEAGTAADPSAKVRSLYSEPPVDPYAVSDPWNYADTSAWVPAEPLDFIVIAPHGRTLDGGFGPVGGLDSFYTNWNPRYAFRDAGNPDGVYDGPPPRFEDFIARDLVAFVEERFATAGHGREWRALQGTSLGGYGSYALGLKHPDVWASVGSVSGAHNFLFAPGLNPSTAVPADGPGISLPLPYTQLPGIGPRVPVASLPEQLRGFGVSFLAFGDPAADHAFYRGNMPRDLAMNARAYAGDEQAVALRAFVNDAIPRTAADLADFPGYLVSQAFEAIVLTMNVGMELAFDDQAVERTFEIHPGLHSGRYWNAFHRAQMEAQYQRVLHWDGTGTPPGVPDRFDYRTVAAAFDVWGWRFEVDREPVEFLTLRSVSCDGLSLNGTGLVTVHVPASCGTGFQGAAVFTIDLGGGHPLDEPLGIGALPFYGAARTITLTPL
ncbi:MAG TPA: alpha/beta hydrolase-fold protein [Actinomycetota bacterium]|nr:alpha/beta hydrolase-fold protein [Actinomycetota bacterium]